MWRQQEKSCDKHYGAPIWCWLNGVWTENVWANQRWENVRCLPMRRWCFLFAKVERVVRIQCTVLVKFSKYLLMAGSYLSCVWSRICTQPWFYYWETQSGFTQHYSSPCWCFSTRQAEMGMRETVILAHANSLNISSLSPESQTPPLNWAQWIYVVRQNERFTTLLNGTQ